MSAGVRLGLRVLAAFVVGAALAACATILGLHDEVRRGAFPHRKHTFAGVACGRCHVGLGDDGFVAARVRTASAAASAHIPTQATCTSCHSDPHTTRDCLGCHVEVGARERRAEAAQHLRFAHAPHLGATLGQCGRCHAGVVDDRPEPPSMATCLGCHDHQADYDVRRCDGCHVDLEAEAPRPASHAVHGVDFTARHGTFAGAQRDYCATCHGERFCAGCHGVSVPALPARLAFDRVGLGVNALHRAGFRARHAEEARANPGSCTSCHVPASCASCHAARGVAARGALTRGPHPEDWVGRTPAENRHGRAARLDPVGCAACHDGAGEQLCVGCHKVGGVGGSVHPPGWRSAKRMSERPCRLCHEGGS